MKLKIPEHIKNLIPYPPGKPIEELEREYGVSGSIKMASNENSLGPSPKAQAAIAKALQDLHRYPDGSCYYLAHKLAARLGVEREQLIFANGSDEILALLAEAFIQPGDEAISSHPSFLVYPKVTQAQGGINRGVPLRDMRHDLPAILNEITSRTRLIFLDNPNNPTGTIFSRMEFEDFLAQVPEQVVVVLDEAYWDFVEVGQQLDARSYINGDRPLVSLRTFSKAYGLAGLRIGYGLMNREIADCLNRVRPPFNVNSLAQIGAMAALDDDEHYTKTLAMTRDGIVWLGEQFRRLGLRPYPTQANFFLVELAGLDGQTFYKAMLRRGVIVRPMTAYGYPDFIRITAGTRAENRRLLAAAAEVLREGTA
ncbi:MAG: histidinol-phosphate transaminase [Deltaproteobacteria bacterium]|nr:histidinol-phosphate transaminase [Deltaproteobacteria bacterium]